MRHKLMLKLADARSRQITLDLTDDYSGQDLHELDFSGHDLTGTNFSQTNLSGCNFKNCMLFGSSFRNARIHRASFCFANLKSASFRYADLRGSNFLGANLTGVNFANTNLQSVDFQGSCLLGANFRSSVWPLWCGSLNVTVDKEFAAQFAYHFCSLICEDQDVIAAQDAIRKLANKFGLVETGSLRPLTKKYFGGYDEQ